MREHRARHGIDLSLEGAIETSAEVFVIFKATIGSYPRFEARLKELHPYEVPEIVALRAADGLPSYLRWVEENAR